MIPEEITTIVKDVKAEARHVRMKADFQVGIQNDYAYISGLQKYLDTMEQVAAHRNKEVNTKAFAKHPEDWKADELMELAHLEVTLNETREKLLLQKKVLADKVQHFTEVFLPMYEKRLEEVAANWEKQWIEVENTIWELTAKNGEDELDLREKNRLERLNHYRDDFASLDKELRSDIEIKSNYYYIFINLLPKK